MKLLKTGLSPGTSVLAWTCQDFLKIATHLKKNRFTFLNFNVQKSSICQNDRQIESYSMK